VSKKREFKRLQDLIAAGITFDQIVNNGMTITDFEMDNIYYMKFSHIDDGQKIDKCKIQL
jgi:hypothetical protein